MSLPANPDNLIVVRLTEKGRKIVLPKYLYYFLEYLWSIGFFSSIAQGTLQQFITVENVKNIAVGSDYRLGDLAEVFILNGKSIREGDILLQRVGSVKNVGRPFYVKFSKKIEKPPTKHEFKTIISIAFMSPILLWFTLTAFIQKNFYANRFA